MDFKPYRKLFPITKSTIYFNHAAVSPLSTRISGAIGAAVETRSSGAVDTYQQYLTEKEKLKSNIGRLINADPAEIALTTNTSEGFNIFVNSLRWQPGDRILLFEGEFPSNVYPFLNLERKQVCIDWVASHGGRIEPDDIEKVLTPQTKLLSISFVQFFTGFRNNLAAIGGLCKNNGIIFSVDGIQGVGALPIDVKQIGIDFLANGGHKWLMGPMGCGFMYINPEIEHNLDPIFAGWLSVKNSWDFLDYDLDFLEGAEKFELGTPNFLGIIGARAATDLLVEIKPEQTERHLLFLGELLIDKLTALGFGYIGSEIKTERSGIYTFTHPDAENIFAYLTGHNVRISLRNGALRISPHFYNISDEIDELVNLCKKYL